MATKTRCPRGRYRGPLVCGVPPGDTANTETCNPCSRTRRATDPAHHVGTPEVATHSVLLQTVRSGVGVAVYPKAGRLPANLRAFLAAVTEGLGRLRS